MTTQSLPSELNVAPGSIVVVRDEEWLVTAIDPSADGWLVHCQGLSELVRDTTASFYEGLDTIVELDPSKAKVIADDSPGYRKARLWLEATLRKTPIPLNDPRLSVSTQMLADPLQYQHKAVRQALDPANLRPRILIADAVGLGKTLEIGMILAELVRRGRGDRILIVTPRHVLEQMQHEMWSRFALPFVRLDSAGIQRVRQQLPATRNPFTFFKRAIISVDTLKNEKYRAHLKRQHWDAVVIDESHNATNTETLVNELVTILAKNTDALIFASATPHNGRPESFAQLIGMLEPTAVAADGKTIRENEAKRLIIRRHRHSPEVAAEVGADWAERKEPINRLVPASAAENAVAEELSTVWLHPTHGTSPYSGANNRLFPWTLAKAFLSSPTALLETVRERIKRLDLNTPDDGREISALTSLELLAATAEASESGKYTALVNYLKSVKVGGSSTERAVVFAERVPTLRWLKASLPKSLGLKPENVAILHGGLTDVEQQEIIDSFKQASSPIRVLVTGDVASEGVNLHSQCHELIHFDIPWSLIRIEQRNGRIDRYGQKVPPQITTLLLTPTDNKFSGDLKVLTRLLEREHEAHTALGDVASLMGMYSVKAEEDAIRDVLSGQKTLDEQVQQVDDVAGLDSIEGFLASLMRTQGAKAEDAGVEPIEVVPEARLYPDDVTFLREALEEAYITPGAKESANGVEWREYPKDSIVQFIPPKDLKQRLSYLPQSYLTDRKVTELFKLATTKGKGKALLAEALRGDDHTTWPEAHFLGPLHPVLDWVSDRALSTLARNQVFAVRADVEHPTVILVGTLTNRRGHVVATAYFKAEFPNPANPEFCLVQTLESVGDAISQTGMHGTPINKGPVAGAVELEALIAPAVRRAEATLEGVFEAATQATHERIAAWTRRSEDWKDDASLFTQRSVVRQLTSEVTAEQRVAEAMEPTRQLVRPLVVLVPLDTPTANPATTATEGI
ncbi:helicase-related protein [Cryobacterium glaciale]|uniref:helicase-related protein n=1 Tax=Cryobacterium glaciale TaxID=1259145 RepID=UPI0018E0785F|nr:helicase-related protein [Cryobacterium glaciale]